MPVRRREDAKGPYYQWGDSGKKYRYTSGTKASQRSRGWRMRPVAGRPGTCRAGSAMRDEPLKSDSFEPRSCATAESARKPLPSSA